MTLIERWDDRSTNRDQQYLTHGIFRYFGKLPPTVTGRILDELNVGPGTSVVDVMSGSGTTLVEAGLRSSSAVGVDCNDLSVLVAKVKTTPVALEVSGKFIREFKDFFGQRLYRSTRLKDLSSSDISILERMSLGVPEPAIRNFDHWFNPLTSAALRALLKYLDSVDDIDLKDLLKVSIAASIRACSNASVRTGRLFREYDKELPNPVAVVLSRLTKISQAIASLSHDERWSTGSVRVFRGDARATGLAENSADVVFCHPPYFALYRYSSDILRFEMEWLGYSRKTAAAQEIEDGFKTTDETLVNRYVDDMADVMKEARRISTEGGSMVIVTADSTLRKERLRIMDPLIERADANRWNLERRIMRTVRFAQASYHRSADQEIRRPEDEILMFRAT